MKDLGRDVFGFRAVVDPPRHKGVDTIEVALVQLRETARIVLGRFNQEPLIRQIGNSVQSCAPGEPTSLLSAYLIRLQDSNDTSHFQAFLQSIGTSRMAC